MKKQILLLIVLLFSTGWLFSQTPDQLLTRWSARSPIEKIHLHLDRDNYVAGETIWFKSYLYSDYQPDTISTSLFVELMKDSVTVLSRHVLPVFLGTANGQFELPDSLATGNYMLRAYTLSMLDNQDGISPLYKRSVFIYGKQKAKNTSTPAGNKTLIQFFPEGGNLVKGFNGSLAFKATDQQGIPRNVSGKIWNDKNEPVTTFTSYHDGMGLIELPALGEFAYYATLDGTASDEHYSLPTISNKGIHISLIDHPQGYFFELEQRTDDPVFQAAYMVGQMQHHVVFQQRFVQGKESQQGVINTKHLNSGVLQVTFFNKDHLPLAERLCFVNNKEYILSGELRTDTLDFGYKARNRFSLAMKDTVQGSFSISIIDNEQSQLPRREENIFSSLLLTGDLRGYVHDPAWYFVADADSAKQALDLVMMTNGWRRFRWEQLLAKGIPPAGPKDMSYITLAGKVNYQGVKKPFSDKQLLLLVNTKDGKRSMQFLKTDADGNFRIDSMIFFDKSRLIFSDVRGKKSQYIDVFMNGDSLRRPRVMPSLGYVPPFSIAPAIENKWKMDYDAIAKANGQMLEEVRLKVIKKSPEQLVDERYTSGAFSGDAAKTIDLVNNDEAGAYQNIFDFLQARVNGLRVVADGFDYSLYYRQNSSISSMGDIPMALFLDEIETDASVISTIPGSQIALVKVYSSFVAASGNAPGGMLALYTKKGQDYSGGGLANQVPYTGYSVIKEFYSPDYKKEESKPDNRNTLLWRPNIILNSIDPVLPIGFYNNDRTKQYRVVIEGLTVSGKMLCIEKVIGTEKRSF
ncbi:MAG: hypothetical protein NTW29_02115 [Bacteroidetes bacterium]|nr:hypothetical protein [Bacteroidota bacterium]